MAPQVILPSLALFLCAGALAPAIGFTGVMLIVAYWSALVVRHGVVDGRLLIPNFVRFLSPMFLVIVGFGVLVWERPFDAKDPAALMLFFVVIPALLCALAMDDYRWLKSSLTTWRVVFAVWSVAVVSWAVVAGVDWQRDHFFLDTLNKNSIGASYEVVMLAVLLNERGFGRRMWTGVVGLLCLALIGSKTALVLTTLVTVIALFGWVGVGVVLIGVTSVAIAFISLGSLSFSPVELNSPISTAFHRIILWAQAWDEITASPRQFWLGVGPGTFRSVVTELGLEGLGGTHNIVLELWHSYGLLGLSLFLGWFVAIGRRFGVVSSPFLTAFWLFNLHALFDVGWVKGAGFIASAALGLGMADASWRAKDSVLALASS